MLDVRDAERKAAWLHEANEGLELVKLAADLLVAASFHTNPKQRKELSSEFEYRMSLAAEAFETIRRGGAGTLMADGNREELAALRQEADDLLQGRTPFHWPLEFPEVFIEEAREEAPGTQFTLNGFSEMLAPLFAQLESQPFAQDGLGFAAIVGNPPFRGRSFISGSLGDDYLSYILLALPGSNGNADLCAHFLRRADMIAKDEGITGFITTNSISQGASRESSLDILLRDGRTFPRAIKSTKWPGAANVFISLLHTYKGNWKRSLLLRR